MFSLHLSNSLETLPRAPIPTGTNFHNLSISLFETWYFSTSPFLFPLLLHQVVQQYWWLPLFALSCQLQLCLVFLSITLSHWTPISHNTSSISTAPSGTCLYHFFVCSNPYFLQMSQWTFFKCRHLYSFWANFSNLLTKCVLYSLIKSAQRIFTYLIDMVLYIVFLVPVQHTTKLLFQSSKGVWIIIAKFCPYQLFQAFARQTVYAFSFHSSFV